MLEQKAAQKAIQMFDGEKFFGAHFSLDFWQDKRDLKQQRIENQTSQMTNMLRSLMNTVSQRPP
jgi:hypothetical protein